MADTNHQVLGKRKAWARKLSARIDMTPMVDLAFLLLTFFILTTTLHEQKTLGLVMPAEGPPGHVNNAITLILSGNDKVYYYDDELKPSTVLNETDFGKVRELLQHKNRSAIEQVNAYAKNAAISNVRDTLKQAEINKIYVLSGINVIIKYDSLATYRNTVDMVDEMDICGVPSGKYAIVKKLETAERKLLMPEYSK